MFERFIYVRFASSYLQFTRFNQGQVLLNNLCDKNNGLVAPRRARCKGCNDVPARARNQALDQLKRDGIKLHNVQESGLARLKYERERTIEELTVCGRCSGFLSQAYSQLSEVTTDRTTHY